MIRPCRETGFSKYLMCERYSKIHLCGDECTERELTPRREGYVCRLTGVCIKGAPVSSTAPFVRDPKRARTEPIRMDTLGGVRRVRTPSVTEIHAKVHAKIAERVVSVFQSPERHQIYAAELERFNTKVDSAVRSKAKPIDLVRMDDVIREIMETFGAGLNPPPVVFTPELKDAVVSFRWLQTAPRLFSFRGSPSEWFVGRGPKREAHERPAVQVSDFVRYFHAVCDVSRLDAEPLERTATNADHFAACMCTWLARGYPSKSNAVIAPHPFFTHHVPPNLHFNGLAKMKCGNMTTFARKFKRACFGTGAFPRPGTVFRFSPSTVTELDRTLRTIERKLMLE